MNYDYYCTVCKGQLLVGDKLVFSAKSEKNKKGLIFLSPELGNYTTEHHPSFQIREGEVYTFYCPICHAALNDTQNSSLVKVFMEDENGEHYEIYFSGIASEKCTYKLHDKQIEAIGPDKDKYAKYYDLPEEYRKHL